MNIKITWSDYKSEYIKKNGIKLNKKYNYMCKNCSRQFINDFNLTYFGCRSSLKKKVELMLVWGVDIRYISEIELISIGKVLLILWKYKVVMQPKQSYYDEIEIDEFWTFVGKKQNKVWLIYAYHRSSGEIIDGFGVNVIINQQKY